MNVIQPSIFVYWGAVKQLLKFFPWENHSVYLIACVCFASFTATSWNASCQQSHSIHSFSFCMKNKNMCFVNAGSCSVATSAPPWHLICFHHSTLWAALISDQFFPRRNLLKLIGSFSRFYEVKVKKFSKLYWNNIQGEEIKSKILLNSLNPLMWIVA